MNMVIPDGCPTCGALPCDWAAGGAEDIAALIAAREADHANINLKADFIDKSLNQLAQADEAISELSAKLKEVINFYDFLPTDHAPGEVELLDSITALLAKHARPTPTKDSSHGY